MLGDKIRTLRKEQNKTLAELATLTELSTSYISQLERNMIEPSLSSLRKLSKALNIPVYLFMEDEEVNENFFVRKNDRILMSFSDGTISYEIASPMSTKELAPTALLIAFSIAIKSTELDTFISHPSDEIVLVLEGELTATIGSTTITLIPGDTAFIKGNTPHRFTNLQTTVVSGYSVFSPPMWPSQKI